ncbi:MAG TPA: hypothetical protein VGJ97_05900 [Anaerolineaceae bacterium]
MRFLQYRPSNSIRQDSPYFIVNGIAHILFNIFWHIPNPPIGPTSPCFYLGGRLSLLLGLVYLLAGWRRRSTHRHPWMDR